MAYEFRFPDVGEGITEGQIVKWRVMVGDVIKQDQILVDIETDKSVAEVPSPVGGTILELRGKEGQMIKVGDVIAVIGEKGEKNVPVQRAVPVAPQRSVGVVGELEEAKGTSVFGRLSPTSSGEQRPKAMLAVKKAAKEKGLDLRTVATTGKSGEVTVEDVKRSSGDVEVAHDVEQEAGVKAQRKYDMFGYVDRVPLVGIRKTIARNMMVSAQNTAAVTSTDEIDVTTLWKIREREKNILAKKGVKLTFMPYIMKALVAALKEHPYVNSSLENDEIVLKKYYNIGFAVDANGQGLLVPVIKGAEQKKLIEIAAEIERLANAARNLKLDAMDMKGGTFTITNYGSVGGLFATPLINYPEAAILGLGRMYDKAVPVKGKIQIRKVLPVSLTFDHRIMDGVYAQQFVNKLKEYLEDPDLLLIT